MHETFSACAKRDHASQEEYHRIWNALVSCMEEVLRSERGAVVPQLGTVTFISRSRRESSRTGHKGCLFIANPKFVRLYSIVQRDPARSLLAPAIPISPVRIAHAAGVGPDRARVAIASMVDAIGRKACAGSTLRIPFGFVGSLVVKARTVTFSFDERFRRPKMDPRNIQDEYDGHVRRLLAELEAKKKSATPPVAEHRRTRPGTCPSVRVDGRGGGGDGESPRHGRSLARAGGVSSRVNRSGVCGGRDSGGDGALPSPGSIYSASASAVGGRPRPSNGQRNTTRRSSPEAIGGCRISHPGSSNSNNSRANVYNAGEDIATLKHPRREVPPFAPTHGGAFEETGSARTARCGFLAMTETKNIAAQKVAAGGSARGAAGGGGVGSASASDDVTPRTAKKVLPHFLAIGNSGNQALVAKEGAEIVQLQAMARFGEVKAANLQLDKKEDDEMRKRQVLKWKEYEERENDERRRLREYLTVVKAQAETQNEEKEKQRREEFSSDNPDPNRAYPCRVEYNVDKEARWRRRWCRDLKEQVELKQRIERDAKLADVSRDRVRAAQLDAAIRADRRRELLAKRQDRAKIHRAWEAQVLSFANSEGGGMRTKNVLLDKIVR